MTTIFRFLSGFFVGAFIGAAVAILTAPSSGTELRRQVCERARSVQDEVSQAARQRRADLQAQLESLRAPRSGM